MSKYLYRMKRDVPTRYAIRTIDEQIPKVRDKVCIITGHIGVTMRPSRTPYAQPYSRVIVHLKGRDERGGGKLRFSGLTWGYNGEGPHALAHLLTAAGADPRQARWYATQALVGVPYDLNDLMLPHRRLLDGVYGSVFPGQEEWPHKVGTAVRMWWLWIDTLK